jgi:UDP-N-acetyl-D-galactosamine dehydrogenase
MIEKTKKKLLSKKSIIGIIGLGYVGLPLAEAFSKKFKVIGFDINERRIKELKNGIDKNLVKKINKRFNKKLFFSQSIIDLKACDFLIITVPTPINKNKVPDLKLLNRAIHDIIKLDLKNKIIILESTIYPTLSQYYIDLISKKTKLKLNTDFIFAFSPERINPGDSLHRINNIDKIVSAPTKKSSLLIKSLYKNIIKKVHTSEKLEESEMAKIIENSQRDINIAFINEVVMICNKLNIDPSKVLKLASTKWNFLKFSPGLVGGHCIGVDPYYLTHKLKSIKYNPKVILSGRSINENYHKYIINFINSIKRIKKNSKFLILGGSYKEDCNDLRNSKSLELYDIIKSKTKAFIYDPYIKKFKNYNFIRKPIKNEYDFVLITLHHKQFYKNNKFNFMSCIKKNGLIYDIKKAKFIKK